MERWNSKRIAQFIRREILADMRLGYTIEDATEHVIAEAWRRFGREATKQAIDEHADVLATLGSNWRTEHAKI